MPGHLTAVPTDATAGADLRKFLASHDVSTAGDRLSASPDLTSLTLIAPARSEGSDLWFGAEG